MPLTVGSRLGHYDVTALIGEGGMGQVYRATDTKAEPAERLFYPLSSAPRFQVLLRKMNLYAVG